jgi:hypothetical protein
MYIRNCSMLDPEIRYIRYCHLASERQKNYSHSNKYQRVFIFQVLGLHHEHASFYWLIKQGSELVRHHIILLHIKTIVRFVLQIGNQKSYLAYIS